MINTIEESLLNDSELESTYSSTLDIFYALVDQKAESDNSRLIIITDYPD